jgi:hypothetical protein
MIVGVPQAILSQRAAASSVLLGVSYATLRPSRAHVDRLQPLITRAAGTSTKELLRWFIYVKSAKFVKICVRIPHTHICRGRVAEVRISSLHVGRLC